jgi:hypothetical protein
MTRCANCAVMTLSSPAAETVRTGGMLSWLGERAWRRRGPMDHGGRQEPHQPLPSERGQARSGYCAGIRLQAADPSPEAVAPDQLPQVVAEQTLSAPLDSFNDRFQASTDLFVHRLETASLNLLQCVEGMRAAAGELREGTGRLERHYGQLETMYRSVERMAAQVAETHSRGEQRLEEVAGNLYAIAESLTTVVGCANQTQAMVAHVAGEMEETADRLDRSVEHLAAQGGGTLRTAAPSAAPAAPAESVTLREVMRLQRQFLNTLDDRFSRLNPAAAALSPDGRKAKTG